MLVKDLQQFLGNFTDKIKDLKLQMSEYMSVRTKGAGSVS